MEWSTILETHPLALVFNGSQPLAKNSIALVTTHRSGVYIATRTPESHSKSQV